VGVIFRERSKVWESSLEYNRGGGVACVLLIFSQRKKRLLEFSIDCVPHIGSDIPLTGLVCLSPHRECHV
jgi:hypothetical protein